MTFRIKLHTGTLPTKDVAGKIQYRLKYSDVVEGVDNIHFTFDAVSLEVRTEVIALLNSIGIFGRAWEDIKILGEVQRARGAGQ